MKTQQGGFPDFAAGSAATPEELELEREMDFVEPEQAFPRDVIE